MKKITLILFVVMLTIYANAATKLYLVANNATTWSGQTAGNTGFDEVIPVDLSTANGGSAYTLTAWLTSSPNQSAGDQVWVAGGTYYVSSVYNFASINFVIYGGFAGTETATTARAKGTNIWDFSSETIIRGDGTPASTTGAFTSGGDRVNAIFDGLTIQGFSTTQALYARAAIVRYCKFISNTFTGLNINTTTSGNSAICEGCYFYSNSTSGASQSPSLLTSPAVGGIVTVKNCTFESNIQATTSTSSAGAGIRAAGAGIVNISNCIVKNNTASAGGASGVSLGSATASISNCLVYGNTGKVGLYATAGNVYNCTFVNNTSGGAYIAAAGPKLYNTVFWGTDGNATSGSGFINTTNATASTSVFQNCAYSGVNPIFTGTKTANIVLPQTNEGTDAPYFVDPINNDWQITNQSSLLDKGDGAIVGSPTTDMLGVARPRGNAYDIGTYEFSGVFTSVKEINNNFVCFATPNSVELRGITAGDEIIIYTTTGAKVISTKALNSEVSVPVTRGVYMVKVANKTNKVVVW